MDSSEGEERYRTLFEHAPDAIVVFDLDTDLFVEANTNACRLFGRTHEELLELGPVDVSPAAQPDGRPSAEAAAEFLARALAGETPVFEWHHLHRDGTQIPCEVRLVRMPPHDRRLVRGSMTDIRERKAATRALELSEERLRLALDAARMGTWTYDSRADRMTYSAQAAAIYRRPPDEMPETMAEALALVHPDDAPQAGARVRQGFPALALPREYRARMPDGTYRWIAAMGELVRTPDGLISGLILDNQERKAAEQALRESEEQLRQVLDSVSTGVWVFDGNRVLLVNAALERLTGYSGEQLLEPQGFLRFVTAETAEILSAHAARRLRGEPVPESYEIPITRADGEVRHLELVGRRIAFRGAPASIVSAFDITERRRWEDELRRSQERFKAVFESASVGIIVFDGEQVVDANPAAGAIFGVEARKLTEPGYMASLTDEATSRAVIARGQARLRGEIVEPTFDARARHASGRELFLHMVATTIDLDGRPASLVTILDTTERRIAEEALRESESRFRSLVDNSPDFITRIGPDLRHEFVNRTAERGAGLNPEFVIGKRADELGYPPETGALWVERHRDVFERAEPLDFEYALENTPEPGRTAHRRARLIPEIGNDGRVHHVLSIVTDITAERTAADERRRLDLQMQHAQKLESLGVLAGGIAHDFNNLLVAILGNAGLALMELPPESPARQTVQSIETAAQRAAELTRQMLAYSGKGRFIIEPLNLSRLVEEMAHLLEVSVAKTARLTYQFAADLPPIEGDATQVRQVIMNLILNASDAIGDKSGAILVRTGMVHADRAYLANAYVDADLPEGDYVFLEVADTGSGMDEETRMRIFDPFFTTKFTGRGLGLAAVLGIVRGHGGAIKLVSEPARGTTFTVLFPRREKEAQAATSPAPVPGAAAPAPGKLVLVIDDDATVRTVTQRMLERAGFEVLVAGDGLEGLEVYRDSRRVDLVLLDMTMPRMDGEETFRELRRLDPNVRVILTSGYNELDATERFAGGGLAGFIQKPYRPSDLIGKVEAALR